MSIFKKNSSRFNYLSIFKNNPIQANWRSEWFPITIIILLFIAGAWFYSLFPESVPIHWNASGQPNRFGSPLVAAFALPTLSLLLYLLFLFLPFFDPQRDQYKQFAGTYHQLKDMVLSFLGLIYFTASFSALGYLVNVAFWTPLFIGILFFWIGTVIDKFKLNCFVGFKTPWTLSHPSIWEKTHRLSRYCFMLAGVLIALSAISPSVVRPLLLILALLIVFCLPTLYSLILYWRLRR